MSFTTPLPRALPAQPLLDLLFAREAPPEFVFVAIGFFVDRLRGLGQVERDLFSSGVARHLQGEAAQGALGEALGIALLFARRLSGLEQPFHHGSVGGGPAAGQMALVPVDDAQAGEHHRRLRERADLLPSQDGLLQLAPVLGRWNVEGAQPMIEELADLFAAKGLDRGLLKIEARLAQALGLEGAAAHHHAALGPGVEQGLDEGEDAAAHGGLGDLVEAVEEQHGLSALQRSLDGAALDKVDAFGLVREDMREEEGGTVGSRGARAQRALEQGEGDEDG
jgi:hypothetical protein